MILPFIPVILAACAQCRRYGRLASIWPGPLTAGRNGGSARSVALQRGIQLVAAVAWGTPAPVWSRHDLSGTGHRPSTSLSGMKWLFAVLAPLAVCAGGSHEAASHPDRSAYRNAATSRSWRDQK